MNIEASAWTKRIGRSSANHRSPTTLWIRSRRDRPSAPATRSNTILPRRVRRSKTMPPSCLAGLLASIVLKSYRPKRAATLAPGSQVGQTFPLDGCHRGVDQELGDRGVGEVGLVLVPAVGHHAEVATVTGVRLTLDRGAENVYCLCGVRCCWVRAIGRIRGWGAGIADPIARTLMLDNVNSAAVAEPGNARSGQAGEHDRWLG